MALAAILVSGVSAVVAAVALVVSIRAAKAQVRLAAIEESRRADEIAHQQRARVVARFEEGYTSGGTFQPNFVLANDGMGSAHEITVKLESALEGVQAPSPLGLDEACPLQLHPGQSQRFPVPLSYDDADRVIASVSWAEA
jgi:hypothetical protein